MLNKLITEKQDPTLKTDPKDTRLLQLKVHKTHVILRKLRNDFTLSVAQQDRILQHALLDSTELLDLVLRTESPSSMCARYGTMGVSIMTTVFCYIFLNYNYV